MPQTVNTPIWTSVLNVLCAEFLRKTKIRKNGIFRPFIPKTHNIIIYLTFLMKSGMS